MAVSTLQTKALSSEKFVESCGAILFDLSNLSDIKVCLVQHRDCGEWHFAKGRRNQGEARKDAAIREVMEETGFRCQLLPVTMPTRATLADAHADVLDKPLVCENLTEPFMCHIRTLKNGKGTKIIWWFIAVLEEDGHKGKLPGEDKWFPVFLPWCGALNTLTFQNDRELLQKALQLLQNTFPNLESLSTGTQTIPLAESIIKSSTNEQSTPEGPISKKAAKKAVKTAKALERHRLQEEQSKSISTKLQGMMEPNGDEVTVSKRTQQQEAKRLRRKAQRHRHAQRKVTQEKAAKEQELPHQETAMFRGQRHRESEEQGIAQEANEHVAIETALNELDANEGPILYEEDPSPEFLMAENYVSASWIGNDLNQYLETTRSAESNASEAPDDSTGLKESARLLTKQLIRY